MRGQPTNRGALQPLAGAGHKAPGALVIGGEYRGLGVVRSLGRRGIPVWVLTDEFRLAGTSRYALRSMPFPRASDEESLDFLLRLAEVDGLEGWVIFPTGDEGAALIARNRAVLSRHYRLTTPSWETLRWAYDKRLTYRLAADLGIPYPWTSYPASREHLEEVACEFPILLKPAYKEGINEFTHAKAWQVEDRGELMARYDEACELVDPEVVMLQELIPGGGEAQFSYAALCHEGQVLASLVARRTRQYPIDFGRASSYVETVDAPEIERLSVQLLASVAYTGLIEVEFKLDARHGCYKLLDLNPRIWGWHTLGRMAGVDFPYLQWLLACGEEVPEVRGRAGARWVRLATDLPAAASLMLQGRLSPLSYLRSLNGPLETAIFAADDLLPGILDLPLMAQVAFKRRMSPV